MLIIYIMLGIYIVLVW